MLKKNFYSLILLIAVIYALSGIYKQLSLLINAQVQIRTLENKVQFLKERNEKLQQSLTL
jgi:cell division protein FtsL